MKGPVPERPAGGGPLRTSAPVRTVPIPDRGAPWGSRREACKLRSHPHPSRPSVVPPSPLKGEGSGGRPLRRSQKPSLLFRRGRTLDGPREGYTPPLRFLRNSSGIGWGRPLGLPPGFAPVATYSAKPGAVVEPRRPQFWNSQAPVGREDTQTATQILRAGNFPRSFRYASPVTGVRGKRSYGSRRSEAEP